MRLIINFPKTDIPQGEKIRKVLAGPHGEETIAELCRRERITQSLYYKWSKEFLVAGKSGLTDDTKTTIPSTK